MKECIERGAVYDIVFGQFCACSDETEAALNRIVEEVRALPNADVKPTIHGEWIEENHRLRSSQFYCSVCHRTAYDIQPTRDRQWKKKCRYAFCPNCGAYMMGSA